MKTILLSFLVFFTASIYAQKNPELVGSTFASDSHYLKGYLTIYFKDGTSQTGEYYIKGTNIKNTDINYEDIDYIKAIYDTKYGISYGTYEYVKVSKNKVLLLKIDSDLFGLNNLKSNKLTFYITRSKLKGSVDQRTGSMENVLPYSAYYMVKEGLDKAVFFKYMNGQIVQKYFSDCKGIIEIYKDRKRRKKGEVNNHSVFEIYNNDCKEGYGSYFYNKRK